MGVIPLGDATRRPTRFPVITASIILVNVLVFVAELWGGDAFVAQWAVIPADIVAGRHWVTILTSMFMHASWSHLISNMVFLWAFGPEVEDLMNRLGYLSFYLLGGLAATLAQLVAGPDSTIPNLGASGAIAGIMGAFLVTYPRDEIRSVLFVLVFARVAYIPAVLLIGVWFLTQFVSLGVVAEQPTGGVAYAAHVGGFIFGTITARLFEGRQRTTELYGSG